MVTRARNQHWSKNSATGNALERSLAQRLEGGGEHVAGLADGRGDLAVVASRGLTGSRRGRRGGRTARSASPGGGPSPRGSGWPWLATAGVCSVPVCPPDPPPRVPPSEASLARYGEERIAPPVRLPSRKKNGRPAATLRRVRPVSRPARPPGRCPRSHPVADRVASGRRRAARERRANGGWTAEYPPGRSARSAVEAPFRLHGGMSRQSFRFGRH